MENNEPGYVYILTNPSSAFVKSFFGGKTLSELRNEKGV